jgi:hypothetical protein
MSSSDSIALRCSDVGADAEANIVENHNMLSIGDDILETTLCSESQHQQQHLTCTHVSSYEDEKNGTIDQDDDGDDDDDDGESNEGDFDDEVFFGQVTELEASKLPPCPSSPLPTLEQYLARVLTPIAKRPARTMAPAPATLPVSFCMDNETSDAQLDVKECDSGSDDEEVFFGDITEEEQFAMQQAHELAVLQTQSTETIVRWWKSIKARRAYNMFHQTVSLAMQQHAAEERTRVHATVCIQRHWRACIAMKMAQQELAQLRKVTTTVQQRWRATQVARASRHHFQQLRAAATTIQQRWRGFVAMKLAQQKLTQLRYTVTSIQQRWRATQVARASRHHFQQLRAAATTIQQRWRGFVAMKLAQQKLTQLRHTVTYIQQRWRATKAARAAQYEFQKLRAAATTIQQRWSACVARRIAQEELAQLRKATITLQQRWRAHTAMKMAKRNLMQAKRAAESIQQRWRARKACMSAQYLYRQLRTAAIAIQQRWRTKRSMQLIAVTHKAAAPIRLALQYLQAQVQVLTAKSKHATNGWKAKLHLTNMQRRSNDVQTFLRSSLHRVRLLLSNGSTISLKTLRVVRIWFKPSGHVLTIVKSATDSMHTEQQQKQQKPEQEQKHMQQQQQQQRVLDSKGATSDAGTNDAASLLRIGFKLPPKPKAFAVHREAKISIAKTMPSTTTTTMASTAATTTTASSLNALRDRLRQSSKSTCKPVTPMKRRVDAKEENSQDEFDQLVDNLLSNTATTPQTASRVRKGIVWRDHQAITPGSKAQGVTKLKLLLDDFNYACSPNTPSRQPAKSVLKRTATSITGLISRNGEARRLFRKRAAAIKSPHRRAAQRVGQPRDSATRPGPARRRIALPSSASANASISASTTPIASTAESTPVATTSSRRSLLADLGTISFQDVSSDSENDNGFDNEDFVDAAECFGSAPDANALRELHAHNTNAIIRSGHRKPSRLSLGGTSKKRMSLLGMGAGRRQSLSGQAPRRLSILKNATSSLSSGALRRKPRRA